MKKNLLLLTIGASLFTTLKAQTPACYSNPKIELTTHLDRATGIEAYPTKSNPFSDYLFASVTAKTPSLELGQRCANPNYNSATNVTVLVGIGVGFSNITVNGAADAHNIKVYLTDNTGKPVGAAVTSQPYTALAPNAGSTNDLLFSTPYILNSTEAKFIVAIEIGGAGKDDLLAVSGTKQGNGNNLKEALMLTGSPATWKTLDQVYQIGSPAAPANLDLLIIPLYVTCLKSEVKTGINELSLSANTNIYPNPSNDFITVVSNMKANQDFTISVYDVAGKLVYNKQKNNMSLMTDIIDVRAFESGLYFVKVESENGVATKKIAVQ